MSSNTCGERRITTLVGHKLQKGWSIVQGAGVSDSRLRFLTWIKSNCPQWWKDNVGDRTWKIVKGSEIGLRWIVNDKEVVFGSLDDTYVMLVESKKEPKAESPVSSIVKLSGTVKAVVTSMGGPKPNSATVRLKSTKIVAIEIDFSSKYCVIGSTSGGPHPGIGVDAASGSLQLNQGLEKMPTLIEFPQYKGWHVFSAQFGKYTARVCLVKGLYD